MKNFGAANQFVPSNPKGEYESNRYTGLQYEYFWNIFKMKVLETRVLAYDIMTPFIVPDLVDEYALEV